MVKLETKYNRDRDIIIENCVYQQNIWNNQQFVVCLSIPLKDSYFKSYMYFATNCQKTANKYFRNTVKVLKANETL